MWGGELHIYNVSWDRNLLYKSVRNIISARRTAQRPALNLLTYRLGERNKNQLWHKVRQDNHELERSWPSVTRVERLAPSLDDLNDAVKELHTQKEESSTEAIGKLIEVFQDSISGNTVRQMETLATTVDDVSQSLKDLPAQMADMMTSVQDKIDQTSLVLSATSEEQMGQTKSMLDGMLNAFQNAIDTQQDGLTETTDRVNEEMRQIASDIRNLLESVANQTNDQLSRRIADFESVLDQQKQAIEEITAGTTKASEESADRMRQFVEHSVTRLGESVQDVELSVGGLLQRQHGQIEAVDAQLASFRDTITKGQEMLQQMNASAASVRQLINTRKISRKLLQLRTT